MADIKEKLERLKKERASRSHARMVKDTWQEIEEEKDISTKEKLERLINLTKERKVEKKQLPRIESEKRESLQFTENPYSLDARYGRIVIRDGLKISSDVLTNLSGDSAFKDLDLSTSLFIDLETTGLSGGTGVIPFNIGMGYFRENKFWVGQYFLGEPADEERMLEDLSRFVQEMDFRSVVTYNGKAFDLPLLETRFILHRLPFLLSGLPHLDFLFPARRLWKHKYESCRLSYLAQEVVETGRTEDIPSAEVPWRYFQYLQTGNFELIESVLYHNAEDILSLLGVVIIGASIFDVEGAECPADAMDFFGAGKILESTGETERSIEFYQRALNGTLTDQVSVLTKKKLADHFKRSHDWQKALPLWQEIVSKDNISAEHLFSFRELSMYYEHQEKKYVQAHKIAEEGYVLSMSLSSYYQQDFAHRIKRLKDKIRKQSDKDS